MLGALVDVKPLVGHRMDSTRMAAREQAMYLAVEGCWNTTSMMRSEALTCEGGVLKSVMDMRTPLRAKCHPNHCTPQARVFTCSNNAIT